MARTITNPGEGSDIDSSVIRTELQTLETEIADTTSGHDHDGTDSKKIPNISSSHFASLSGANLTGIPETAISDGSVLARVGGNETITGLYDFTNASGLKTDNIVESTSATGVTIDSVLLKDGGVTLSGNLALAGNSITGTSVDINNAELQQLSNIGATTISATQWGYLGAMAAQPVESLSDLGLDSNLADLTTSEVQQLENIGATTISSDQWGYLGSLDQSLATTDDPTFGGITLSKASTISSSSFIPLTLRRTSEASTGQSLAFQKIRGSSMVQSGDEMGKLFFYGYDGSNYIMGAEIKGEVDGTPGTDDMPGRIVFKTTADGASSATEAMRIGSSGGIFAYNLKSGTDQANAGAAANELYIDTDDNSIKIGT